MLMIACNWVLLQLIAIESCINWTYLTLMVYFEMKLQPSLSSISKFHRLSLFGHPAWMNENALSLSRLWAYLRELEMSTWVALYHVDCGWSTSKTIWLQWALQCMRLEMQLSINLSEGCWLYTTAHSAVHATVELDWHETFWMMECVYNGVLHVCRAWCQRVRVYLRTRLPLLTAGKCMVSRRRVAACGAVIVTQIHSSRHHWTLHLATLEPASVVATHQRQQCQIHLKTLCCSQGLVQTYLPSDRQSYTVCSLCSFGSFLFLYEKLNCFCVESQLLKPSNVIILFICMSVFLFTYNSETVVTSSRVPQGFFRCKKLRGHG